MFKKEYEVVSVLSRIRDMNIMTDLILADLFYKFFNFFEDLWIQIF